MAQWKEITDYNNHSRHPDSRDGLNLYTKFRNSKHWKLLFKHDRSSDSSIAEKWSETYARLVDGVVIEISVTSSRSRKQRTFSFDIVGG